MIVGILIVIAGLIVYAIYELRIVLSNQQMLFNELEKKDESFDKLVVRIDDLLGGKGV